MKTIIFIGLSSIFLVIVLAIVKWMKNLENYLKDKDGKGPLVFFNFKKELLPMLGGYWLLALLLFLFFGWPWLWVILMVTVFRIIVQQAQQRAIVEQMVAVVLPRLAEDRRKELMRRVMESVSQIEENRRRGFIKSMLSGLEFAPEETRQKIVATRTQVLAELSESERKTIMKSMDAIMLGT